MKLEPCTISRTAMRPSEIGGAPCRQAVAYGMAWRVLDDCDLGRVLTHGGGYPGYGSNVLLLPDENIGVFVFTNRTYAGPSIPAFKTALAMKKAQAFEDRVVPISNGLADGHAVAKRIWAAGDVSIAKDDLAMNFMLDRDAKHWKTELAGLKAEVGSCAASEPITASSAMSGAFTWNCEHGRITGKLLLAPTPRLGLQGLEYGVTKP